MAVCLSRAAAGYLAPRERLAPERYATEANRRTETALLEGVRAAVAGGQSVIVDGTFLEPAWRDQLEQAAGQASAGPAGGRPGRVGAAVGRAAGDASSATSEVLRAAAAWSRPRRTGSGWMRECASMQEQVQTRLAML